MKQILRRARESEWLSGGMLSLFGFYGVYFIATGVTTFNAKYFGEIGMSDADIGILMSVPGIIGIFFQGFWGSFSDRVRLKKTILIFAGLAGGLLYILTGLTQQFWLILLGMTAINFVQMPINPVGAAISMEYTETRGTSFGPIRLSGTIGYQIGALAVGFILTVSLKGLFPMIGALYMLCAVLAVFLPNVEGHQHGKKKISFFVLLKDKRVLLLLAFALVGCTASAFYNSFFTKHLGDLGIDNGVTGVITFLSTFLEIPFLLFAQRLYKKCSIWVWMMAGLILNGVRFLGLAFAADVPWIILANLPCVSIMACFEFFPGLYLNEIVRDELKGSAQNLLVLTTFGITKITGALIGGFLCDSFGIPVVFGGLGIMLLAAAAVFLIPCRRIGET